MWVFHLFVTLQRRLAFRKDLFNFREIFIKHVACYVADLAVLPSADALAKSVLKFVLRQ